MALIYNKNNPPILNTIIPINKKFIYNQEDLQNLIIQNKAKECHVKGGKDCLGGANLYYNRYISPEFQLPNTWKINEAAGITSGNKNSTYGESADSWDLAALLLSKGAIKNYAAPLYNKNKTRRTEKDAVEFWNALPNDYKNKLYSQMALGTLVNFGDYGDIDESRKQGANEKAGLYPSRHSARVVGFSEIGEPIVYDYGEIKPISKAGLGHPITNIVTPKEVVQYNYNYVKNWQKNNENKIGLKYDPNEKLYLNRQSLNKNEIPVTVEESKFVEGINKNIKNLMQVTGASQEDIIKAGKVAFGILQNETRGGRDSFDAKTKEKIGKPLWNAAKKIFTLGYADIEEASKGLTRMKAETLSGDENNKYSQYLKQLGLDPKNLDLWDPEQSALATTALILSRKGKIDGVDNWYLKAQQHNTPAVGPKNEEYLKNADKNYATNVIKNANRLYSPNTGQGLIETEKWIDKKKKENFEKELKKPIIKEQLYNTNESTNVNKPIIINIPKKKIGGLLYKK